MRILVVNWQDKSHPQSGGAESHLHSIFSRIAAKGHHVTLLCCGHGKAPHRETCDGINIVRIGRRPWFNYIVPLWWTLVGKGLKFDIVIDDINKLPFFTPRFVRKIPILAIIHHFFGDSIYQQAGRLTGKYVLWFEKQIPRVYANIPICVVSESTKQECIDRGIPDKNIHIIYNGIDASLFPFEVTTKATTETLVYFGRLKRYKSIDHILHAMVKVREQFPNVVLDVIGTGDDQTALEEIATALGLIDVVRFHGFVEDSEKAKHLSRAYIDLNPSVKEGWGITNIEANACGTPVISADVPGLRDSVKHEYSGMLYPYGDIDELARLICLVLADASLRERLSMNAIEWARRFTWDAAAQQMLELCADVIQQRRQKK